MLTLSILGAGNVATHLFEAFSSSQDIRLLQWFGRDKKHIEKYKDKVDVTEELSDLKPADVYIVAISDDAIGPFSETLPFKNSLVAHTSGSVDINALDSKHRRGVFYPLQTLSRGKKTDFNNIPLCLEAEKKEDLDTLKTLAEAISQKIYEVNSEQRRSMHLAAVFVNNFVNHLYQIGSDICHFNDLSFEILQPLIEETSKKIKELPPYEAQTGPAKRGDAKTIEKQLYMLENSFPQYTELYKTLTSSILSAHGGKKL
ncbi:DUF2520 domain-containing protein [Leptobacterium flavescens]|uniref:DUF2520 domain-containing protein n=1 Tax=Leptobacterium flavescens TaxID=472055 RepID=A0A6P0UKY3_9FLAO|nr:DUF2520 domain-containing protein [Leptobacterium flavescens]NER14031.1 DUF2520 domain-containing protein [Leptobacterium flavescens]